MDKHPLSGVAGDELSLPPSHAPCAGFPENPQRQHPATEALSDKGKEVRILPDPAHGLSGPKGPHSLGSAPGEMDKTVPLCTMDEKFLCQNLHPLHDWLVFEKGYSDAVASTAIDTMLKAALKAIRTGKTIRKPRAWLMRVASRAAYRAWKQELPCVALAPDALEKQKSGLVVEDDEESTMLSEKINEAVNNLPERQRQAFNLAYVEGVSQREGAKVMNVSSATFCRLCQGARQKLASAFHTPPNRS